MKTKFPKLPAGWIFHHDLHLMVFRPRGIVTKAHLHRAIEMLEVAENEAARPFNRYTDLSKLEAIDVDFKTMFGFSLHRRLAYSKRLPVKSAVYVTSPASVHVAKIHALLTDYSPLKVRIFYDIPSIAKWLHVSVETLELDPFAGTNRKRKTK